MCLEVRSRSIHRSIGRRYRVGAVNLAEFCIACAQVGLVVEFHAPTSRGHVSKNDCEDSNLDLGEPPLSNCADHEPNKQ